jgi:hypothetical protein
MPHRPLQTHCHFSLGKLYARSRRPGKACAELSTAIGLYHAMEMTFWLPQAEATLSDAASTLSCYSVKSYTSLRIIKPHWERGHRRLS